MKNSAPKPPRAAKLANLQGKASSISGPFGSVDVSKSGQKISLSPDLQNLSGQLTGSASNMAQYLPQDSFSLSDVPQGMDLQNNFYNQQLGLMQPGFDDQLRQFEVRAAERGLPVGSEAWDHNLSPILREQNRAKQQAAYGAVQLTPQEEQRQIQNALLQRQLPFLESGMSMGLLNQIPVPQAQQPINVAGLHQNQYNQQMQQSQQDNAGLGSLLGSLGFLGGSALGGPFGGKIGSYLFG